MKRSYVWRPGIALLLIGLLSFPMISLAEDGKWTRRADMPTPRGFFSASSVDGKIYATGGWAGGAAFSVVEAYDPALDVWLKKADMPTPRSSVSTADVNGRIYAVGGWTDLLPAVPTTEEYDPAADGWGRRQICPQQESSSLSLL
ncbi:kelch repeat-containing protein [Candidatus Poribacteria bacterium]